MTLLEQLLAVTDAFCAATGLSEARVSTRVFSGGRRIQQIRDGGDVGTMSFERAMRWFSENWPEGAEWPAGVPRPEAEIDAQSSTAAAVTRAAAAHSSSFPLPVEG